MRLTEAEKRKKWKEKSARKILPWPLHVANTLRWLSVELFRARGGGGGGGGGEGGGRVPHLSYIGMWFPGT